MAIGSSPEIGVTFKLGWDSEEMRRWKELVGPELLGGYATLCYVKDRAYCRVRPDKIEACPPQS